MVRNHRTVLGPATAALLAVPAVAGCAAAGRPDVEAVAAAFYAAYTREDGAAACALLAPTTREELEQSAGAPCATGLLDETLPRVGRVTASDLYGDQAQVRLEGDTTFVAQFEGGWKVVAAGCVRRPQRPYDCAVEPG
jgi:hypothetical protein